jgi:hypothetical protein
MSSSESSAPVRSICAPGSRSAAVKLPLDDTYEVNRCAGGLVSSGRKELTANWVSAGIVQTIGSLNMGAPAGTTVLDAPAKVTT